MEITVYIYNGNKKDSNTEEINKGEINKEEIFTQVDKIIKEACGLDSIDWNSNSGKYVTNIASSSEKVKAAFEEIIKINPDISLFGHASYSVREDDGSADWWVTEEVYTQKENGHVTIKESCQTDWN